MIHPISHFLQIQPLLDLVPDSRYPLRLIEADLQKPESWAKAIKSCSYVFHLASPFPDKSKRQPTEEEIIRPAVDGTLNVLKACAEAGTVKRVLLTSSIAAISCGMSGSPDKPRDHVYSESDWSDEAGCELYERSKLLAERAAWDFVKTLEEDKQFELVVLNPGYVQGPLRSASSGEGSKVLCVGLLGKFPVLVDMNFPIVDVRDVVAAHIAAFEKSEAAGNRYALVNKTLSMKEVAQFITEEFKPQGYSVPSMSVPKFVAWVGKLFDPALKSTYPVIGKVVHFNNEKMVRELGVTPRPLRDTIVDTCYSLIELGVVRKTQRYLGPPSTRPPPPSKEEPEMATEQEQPTSEPGGTSTEPESQEKTTPEPVAEKPTPEPATEPQEKPTPEPVAEPQETEPVAEPQEKPTPEPVAELQETPTPEPVAETPTPEPVAELQDTPTPEPVAELQETPTPEPVVEPQDNPTPELES